MAGNLGDLQSSMHSLFESQVVGVCICKGSDRYKLALVALMMYQTVEFQRHTCRLAGTEFLLP